MFLSSQEIRTYISSHDIECDPSVGDRDIRPFGIRLHLDVEFLRPLPGKVFLDGSSGDPEYENVSLGTDGYLELAPGAFLLGSTVERFRLTDRLAGFLDGRSTLARLGLFIHVSSQIIDGTALAPRSITLELFNAGPNSIMISKFLPVGMLSFFRSEHASETTLIHSQYAGQYGATPPRLEPTYGGEASA